jgi:hypothetical protein
MRNLEENGPIIACIEEPSLQAISYPHFQIWSGLQQANKEDLYLVDLHVTPSNFTLLRNH